MRAEAPVRWNRTADGGGFWSVTKAEDIATISRDPSTFSSAREGFMINPDVPFPPEVTGVIFLALISYGAASSTDTMPPLWVIVSCAVAIALGTYLGGWRVIRTMSKGLVEIESPQGMAADTSSATIILLSSHFGYALSTTHVATGSILGSGVGKPGAEVRWRVAGRMIAAWLVTLPSAGIVGAATYFLVHGVGGYAGTVAGFGLLVAVATGIWVKSRQVPVNHTNVTEEWQGDLTAGIEKPQQLDSAPVQRVAEPIAGVVS